MAPSTELRREARPIPVRRLDFAFETTSPRDYFAGDAHLTMVLNALSTFFPIGETFFVDAVRHYRDRIDDPALSREITAFAGQEAMHSKEHELFNALLERQGLPKSKRLGEWLAKSLLDVARKAPPERQLAATVTLEHFTAILAEQLLGDPAQYEMLRGPAKNLWLWHALEESEHKTVAYDVYEAVDGSYAQRVLVAVPVSVIFVAAATLTYVAMLAERGLLSDVRGILRAQHDLWVAPGHFRKLVRPYFAFYRRGFHPDDHDARPLTAKWNEALFGANGALRERLRHVRVYGATPA